MKSNKTPTASVSKIPVFGSKTSNVASNKPKTIRMTPFKTASGISSSNSKFRNVRNVKNCENEINE